MSTVNVMNSATSSGAMQSGGAVPQPVVQQPVRTDAEVVAQVANTVIKPSNVDATSQPTREVVAKAAADIQQFVQSMGRNLSFSVDEVSGYHVVRVVNPSTGELVRQLPSEELLKIARDFERLNNVLVSQRA
jgi:flagellar protein FlaG